MAAVTTAAAFMAAAVTMAAGTATVAASTGAPDITIGGYSAAVITEASMAAVFTAAAIMAVASMAAAFTAAASMAAGSWRRRSGVWPIAAPVEARASARAVRIGDLSASRAEASPAGALRALRTARSTDSARRTTG